MRKCHRILFIGLISLLICSTQALASSYNFEWQITGDKNGPTITLTNESTVANAAHQIASFSMTIGYEYNSFDYSYALTASSSDITMTRTTDDGVNGGKRYALLSFDYTNFDAGESVGFQTDIDSAWANDTKNFRNTLWGNGDSDNSLLTVIFADGTTLSSYLPDYESWKAATYVFNYATDAAPTPLPAAVWLLGSGLLGLVGVRRARRA